MTEFGSEELEQLLAGRRDGLRPGAAALAQLLAAAAAPAEAGPQPGECDALIAFRALVPSPARPARARMLARMASARVAVVATSGVVMLGGGVAAAATGSLPGAAQQTAHDVLNRIGITVPGPNAHAGNHPDTRGHSGTAPGEHPQPAPAASSHPAAPATGGSVDNRGTGTAAAHGSTAGKTHRHATSSAGSPAGSGHGSSSGKGSSGASSGSSSSRHSGSHARTTSHANSSGTSHSHAPTVTPTSTTLPGRSTHAATHRHAFTLTANRSS